MATHCPGCFPLVEDAVRPDADIEDRKFLRKHTCKGSAASRTFLNENRQRRSDSVSGFVVLAKTLDRPEGHPLPAQSLAEGLAQVLGESQPEKASFAFLAPRSSALIGRQKNSAIRP